MRSSNEGASSVRRAIGPRAIWAIALAGLTAVGGCASGRKDPPATDASGPVDLNTGRRVSKNGDKTTVVVDNQNLNEMTIYAYQGTQRMRLGRVRANGTTELVIPSSMISGVVQLRFYAGLNVEETAAAMGISVRTVNREWSYARAWLFRELELMLRERAGIMRPSLGQLIPPRKTPR